MEVTVTDAEQDSRARRRGVTRGLSREAGAAGMGGRTWESALPRRLERQQDTFGWLAGPVFYKMSCS